jgi:type IV secretory pathway protease TraF
VSGRRAVAAAVIATAVAAGAILARPARYEVEGLSMAPGLMPGDVVASGWLPAADRLRRPRRFERWIVVPPEGGGAIKRVVGLPHETVEIRAGDLVVNEAVVRKDPTDLAEVAIPVMLPLDVGRRHAWLPAAEVLDDNAFANEVNRSLEVVRDVGLITVLRTGPAAARATVVLGDATLRWRLPPQARIRLIAGRLDGHRMAVAWRDRGADTAAGRRNGFPSAVPTAWSFAEPYHAPLDATAPRCEVHVSDEAQIDEAVAWRDVHLRPAADGTAAWRFDSGSYLVLGDFPSGSIDSRTWGPLPATALRYRVRQSR